MASPVKNPKAVETLFSLLGNKDAEACRDMAEEFFRQENHDFALCAIEAARLRNPNLPGLKSYFASYIVNKLAVEGRSWYSTLGIKDPRNAKIDEIKENYDALWLLFRPGTCSSVAAETATTIINKAWEVLSDAKRREAYDILMGYNRENVSNYQTSVNVSSSERLRNPSHASLSLSSPSSCLHHTKKVLIITKKGQHTGKKVLIVRRKTPFKIVREVGNLRQQ